MTKRKIDLSQRKRIVFLWLPEQPYQKGNGRQAVKRKSKAGNDYTAFIKSPQALAWQKQALARIPADLKGMELGHEDRPVFIEFVIWYASRRPDLDKTLILDTLEEARVLSNDRQYYLGEEQKRFCKAYQGTAIRIEEINPPGFDPWPVWPWPDECPSLIPTPLELGMYELVELVTT